jgi:SNF2 family DNA or RNA helicase
MDYIRSHPNLAEQERERRIGVVEGRIRELQLQLARFEEKIGNSDELCPVCYDVAGQTTPRCTTMCCNNIFCMGCLHEALRSTRGKCPMCRAHCSPANCVVDSSGHHLPPDQPPGKVEQLLDILRETDGSRVLIFSSWDASYETVKAGMPESCLPRLCGNSNQMKASLKRFVSGERKVLWINSSNFGSGINLQSADHVVIYHKMSEDLTSQIIGRAQRSGRTTPLVVHQLCHANE